MGKKKNLETRLLEMIEKEGEEVRREVNEFCFEGSLVNFQDASKTNPFDQFYMSQRTETIDQSFTDEQMERFCSEIRDRVKHGSLEDIEINLMERIQRYKGLRYSLENTAIKILPWNAEKPEYLCMGPEDSMDALVFLGGENAQAFLVTRNEDDLVSYYRLSEFHMLSLQKTPDQKELGLITSYVWLTAKVYSTVVMGFNLDPIKNLFFTDSLREKAAQEQAKHIERNDELWENSQK